MLSSNVLELCSYSFDPKAIIINLLQFQSIFRVHLEGERYKVLMVNSRIHSFCVAKQPEMGVFVNALIIIILSHQFLRSQFVTLEQGSI